MTEQIKYVAVRPNGSICGPVGDDYDFVQYSLKIGHKRAGGSGKWEDIKKAGYSVRKCKIILIKE